MLRKALAVFGLIMLTSALIRFPCSQLVVERLDPLVEPGVKPGAHLHQIVGGNAFNVTMDKAGKFVNRATCTTCQFSEDFSNYWTAVMYFRAKNGTYKRVPQRSNTGFDGQKGGMTVYYMQDPIMNFQQTSKVKAFPPGFRMILGNPDASTLAESRNTGQVTYICLETLMTRAPMIKEFPKTPCKAGIMVNLFFPTCWDGKTLDPPDHKSHMRYATGANGIAKGSGNTKCPASHPVKVPQLMLETIWDTRQFNDKSQWPKDTAQPFVWSFGDRLGYGNHGDYVFGWKDNSLQKIVDTACYVNCPGAKQSMAKMNQCTQKPVVDERIDGWLPSIPGGVK